jgi:acyl phosphate:glycerol-3-phosphate acyltransferase
MEIPVVALIAIALVGYLIGSIPAGYLAGRLAGVDIRATGSGNIGATNVTRVLGKRYGYPVFFADFLKGMGAVGIATLVGKHLFTSPHSYEVLQIVAAVSCVIGNAFPVWLHFRGGKGVATSAGVFFGLMPLAAVVGVVVWVVTFAITRYVSVASIMATVALPITVFVMMYFKQTNEFLFLYFTICLAVVVILRHRSNLSRLMRGTEQRFRRE